MTVNDEGSSVDTKHHDALQVVREEDLGKSMERELYTFVDGSGRRFSHIESDKIMVTSSECTFYRNPDHVWTMYG